MERTIGSGRSRFSEWLSRETEFDSIRQRIADEPTSGIAAWARTTSGLIALLLFLQVVTGVLLAFHYVPAATSAYTTVSYIELAVGSGSWIRSLHYHSSIFLPVALALHLAQMIARSAFRSNPTAWIFGIVLLGLVLAAGATGYALPWDLRAMNGVNIAASLAGNAPLIGESARNWLINGSAISTLTLSRFYGLHVYVLPILISASVICRLFLFGSRKHAGDRDEQNQWITEQLARNAIVVGLAFVCLAAVSSMYPAPLGPQIAESATYLPRPGPQFLWLFEMQKYTDGAVAAVLALGFPGLILGGLVAFPILLSRSITATRIAVATVFVVGLGVISALTVTAIYQDSSEIRIAAQLAKQELDEAEFRKSTFEPKLMQSERASANPEITHASLTDSTSIESPIRIPTTYTSNCAKCHGSSGEGTAKFPELTGITDREEDPLTPEMVLAIINDPKAVGYSSKMPAYKNKLSEPEKGEIVAWIRSLKPVNETETPVTTARVDENKK
ncbi:MAG: cytochrome b N-terminal domain-containing protein [Pyrinomonadaceae bacterium]